MWVKNFRKLQGNKLSFEFEHEAENDEDSAKDSLHQLLTSSTDN